jgi:major vault protein
VVETADHARLSIQISYNWYFEVSAAKNDQTEAEKLFSIPDFVGDMCKKLASRIRGAIAGVNFDEFHKNSARIIRGSVFGFDRASNRVQDRYSFEENLLNITSVDIQSVEPIDQRTRDSLMKSVQLAIEITTNSQEATAKHAAQEIEQEAKGKLKRKAIEDEELAEKSRQKLLTLQSESAALESTGQAKAEAQSRAESARIEGNAAVEQATLKAQAANIDSEAELKRLTFAREAEIKFQRESNEIEIEKATQIAKIETDKFKEMVACMGADTIKAMASAGQDHQIKLLQSLGLKSTLITDGRNPINLLSTANGFVQQNGPRITEEQEINE